MKKDSLKKIAYLFAVAVLLFLSLNVFYKPDISEKNLKADTFERLGKVKAAKKDRILNYFDEVKKKAENLENDTTLLAIFDGIKKGNYYVPARVEFELDVHFVREYENFYDILFVDTTGYVFHSIKREPDYMTNIIKDMPDAGLSKFLAAKRDDSFVSYEYYRPSDEPAAFFVVPRKNGGKLEGWIVLQISVNRINTMLTDYRNLGRTGEVYLVNRDKLMLSDSRFIDDSTILKLRVDTEAVKDAINKKRGDKVIVDYRGKRVFSSYEEFQYFGVSWVLVAEIDEDEIYTDYYVKHKKELSKEVVSYLGRKKITKGRLEEDRGVVGRVDLSEFSKVLPGELLRTYGVSTCTSVAILYPNKFGYLAHITPDDFIYTKDSVLAGVFSEKQNDLLRELLGRVDKYNIYPYEKEKVKIYIVAPHEKSFRQAVDKIIDSGYELSNIYYAYNPLADNATVTLSAIGNGVAIQWRYKDESRVERGSDLESLGQVVKRVVRYSH